ncbi:trypsin-like serine protease [Streptomyces heilongjiangensis]
MFGFDRQEDDRRRRGDRRGLRGRPAGRSRCGHRSSARHGGYDHHRERVPVRHADHERPAAPVARRHPSDRGGSGSHGSALGASDMVCAGHTSGGLDTCQGDSGGSLMIGGVLAGMTSWGHGCADARYPGVRTRLATSSGTVAAQGGPGAEQAGP